ncbi:MAG: methyltransferase, partial [Ardenticatenales bacterium]
AGVDADIDTAPLRPPRLADLRLAAVVDALHSVGARRVVDLGCGEGRLLEALLRDAAIEHVAGMDVAHRALERAAARLRLDDMAPAQRARVSLFQGALTYRDARLAGYDAACAVEVIEHLDPERLPAFERVVFGAARPGVAIITTPNAEYNTRYPTLADGVFRHADHRFEWSRAEFRAWGDAVAGAHGYTVRYVPVGDDDPAVGPPTQMAVFERCA